LFWRLGYGAIVRRIRGTAATLTLSGSKDDCRLFTSAFTGNDTLLGFMDTDKVFYLEAVFRSEAGSFGRDYTVTTTSRTGGQHLQHCAVFAGRGGVPGHPLCIRKPRHQRRSAFRCGSCIRSLPGP